MERTLVNCLVRILGKDRETYEHSLRVGKIAKFMASNLKGLDESDKQRFIVGCYLHDIGKVMVPNEILNKPLSLSAEEWRIIKRHPEIGARLLLIEEYVDEQILDIVKYHHERWDGLGYPYGLKGNEIPVFSRICSIIDAFDTMVSNRPYRKGLPIETAKEELHKQSWLQFDGFYVTQFLNLPEHLLRPIGNLYEEEELLWM